ncbi:UPF0246 protein [Proteiniborus sp. DW1]|uniref:peroxide stress protein YaaA n=1 Tax=Proteiniborus sp. DW1 TaxID=1889883 RepID=UPI00092E09F0|nr:peroxide stress protein YaaA [Proteiniborus sp. DW1]SCG84046.1 UPF0246 protein [Proteiniborus sp. DW1]
MRIIISPAKKMKVDTDTLNYNQLPYFIDDTKILMEYLKGLSYEDLKSIWDCNDKIATLNYERIQSMNLYRNLTPAILSFEGIQYQYMAPVVFQTEEYEYIEEHLRILSGFYGMLRPFDGVVTYRLEMQAKLKGYNLSTLYEFWNSKIANKLFSESNCIVNLASKEYSKCISKYLNENIRFVTCVFGEMIDEKIIEKGTLVKMARGEMVRFMAENKIEYIEDIKSFDRLNYVFKEHLSNKNTYVFLKKET